MALTQVSSGGIKDGSITNADLNASASIAGSKISPDFGSQTVTTTGVISAAAGAAGTPSIAFTGDLNTGIYSPGADQVAISTNGTGRLFVDASGNVGTLASPSARLHITYNGQNNFSDFPGNTIRLEDTDISVQAEQPIGKIEFCANDETTPNAGVMAYILSKSASTIGGGDLRFGTTSTSGVNSERVRITSAGLVGIGTTTPSHLLNVIATLNTQRTAGIGGPGEAYSTGPSASTNFSPAGTQLSIDSGSSITDNASLINFGVRTGSGNSTGAYFGAVAGTASNGPAHLVFGRRTATSTWAETARIDNSGRLLVGTPTSRGDGSPFQVVNDVANPIEVFRGQTNTSGPAILFNKSRGSTASPTLVSSGDSVGGVAFKGYDGTAYRDSAVIEGLVDGTPAYAATALVNGQTYRIVTVGTTDFTLIGAASNTVGTVFTATGPGTGTGTAILNAGNMPGRIVLSTTSNGASSPTERMRLNSSGQLLVGTTSASGNAPLQVAGGVRLGQYGNSPNNSNIPVVGETNFYVFNLSDLGSTNTWITVLTAPASSTFRITFRIGDSDRTRTAGMAIFYRPSGTSSTLSLMSGSGTYIQASGHDLQMLTNFATYGGVVWMEVTRIG